jgi:hypothetical protein
MPYDHGVTPRWGHTKPERHNTMKSLQLAAVVILGVIVATALMLSFRSLVLVDSIIGFSAVFALLAIMALEYRFNWKRPLGR